jgi:carboxypeptidase PM20D1
VRTTTALTVFRAGAKENVLPCEATALVNHRIHPADSVDSVLARDRAVVNDARVRIEPTSWTEPSPVSSVGHAAYTHLAACVREIFPGAAVAPGLFVAASDSKHFWGLTDQIFRFSPVTLRNDELDMFHGTNERIGVRNYAKLVAFFRAFHKRASS